MQTGIDFDGHGGAIYNLGDIVVDGEAEFKGYKAQVSVQRS